MRLPQPLLDSQFFQFTHLAELLKATESLVTPTELDAMRRMAEHGLPPITSRAALSAMLGVNPGLIYSFVERPHRYYRTFEIPKGRTTRRIDAPRVGLKVIQKWISVRLHACYRPPDHVFGFVAGLSHVQAAGRHCHATWTFGVDIKDFFQTTPIDVVTRSLSTMGFEPLGAELVARLCCLRGSLAQGAPSSPVLSNICFTDLDGKLATLAERFGVRLTRYADDIVFSGSGEFPELLRTEVLELFSTGPWRLAVEKTRLDMLPRRLKVHGLLVHGDVVRLTKGYRNRIRAYQHLLAKNGVHEDDLATIRGHISYSKFVAAREGNGTPV